MPYCNDCGKKIDSDRYCEDCKLANNPSIVTCGNCKGNGWVDKRTFYGYKQVTCLVCMGKGKVRI
ncbi:MAG: hypothetical protein ACTSYF_00110 [Promethearchaeota archaeon]